MNCEELFERKALPELSPEAATSYEFLEDWLEQGDFLLEGWDSFQEKQAGAIPEPEWLYDLLAVWSGFRRTDSSKLLKGTDLQEDWDKCFFQLDKLVGRFTEEDYRQLTSCLDSKAWIDAVQKLDESYQDLSTLPVERSGMARELLQELDDAHLVLEGLEELGFSYADEFEENLEQVEKVFFERQDAFLEAGAYVRVAASTFFIPEEGDFPASSTMKYVELLDELEEVWEQETQELVIPGLTIDYVFSVIDQIAEEKRKSWLEQMSVSIERWGDELGKKIFGDILLPSYEPQMAGAKAQEQDKREGYSWREVDNSEKGWKVDVRIPEAKNAADEEEVIFFLKDVPAETHTVLLGGQPFPLDTTKRLYKARISMWQLRKAWEYSEAPSLAIVSGESDEISFGILEQ